MLLAFLVQCLWVANTRKLSDLEYRYITVGLTGKGEKAVNSSPFTGWWQLSLCAHLRWQEKSQHLD